MFTCGQGRIQDFKLGGGTHLKKLHRAKGGANIFEVFRVKNHDFTPKKSYFFQFQRGGGGGGGGEGAPGATPMDPPLGLSGLLLLAIGSLVVFVLREYILKVHMLISSEHKLCQT